MGIEDNMKDIQDKAKKTTADGKEAVKDSWTQTKANAEKAKNAAEAEVDKRT